MDTPDTDAKLTVLTVRLPAALAEKMRRLAKAHDRSLNGEIVRALRVYGEPSEPSEQERSL
jgi:predicted transcriptional regulator